jgi:hypothetical protein
MDAGEKQLTQEDIFYFITRREMSYFPSRTV